MTDSFPSCTGSSAPLPYFTKAYFHISLPQLFAKSQMLSLASAEGIILLLTIAYKSPFK
jgi:hypothetical protein